MSSSGSMADKATSECECDSAPCVKVCKPPRKKSKGPTTPKPEQRPYGGRWGGAGGGGGGGGKGGKAAAWRRWWYHHRRFGSRFVQTRTVTIPKNSVGAGCTQNPYRTGVVFQRTDTGGQPTIVRVHQSGSSPYVAGPIPTGFVGFIETRQSNLSGPFTWPPDLHFSEELSRVVESDLCLVNTDVNNDQSFTVVEIFDLRERRNR